MPQVASININDGAVTPVAHTFSPLSCTPGNTVLVAREGNTSAGNLSLIATYDAAKTGRKTHRVSIRFNMPVEALNSTTGLYEVVDVGRFSADVVIPDSFTAANRDDLAAFIKNALANSVINGYISDLDPMY